MPYQSVSIKTGIAFQETLIDFALRVYDRPGIKSTCLRLQDESGANVNIVLWCCWLRNQNVSLSVQWLDDVLISVDTLSQLTVDRMREVRRVINESAGFTRVQAKLINKHILNAELTVEKIFLQRMQDLTLRFVEAEGDALESGMPPERLSLLYYLDFLKIPKPQAQSSSLLALCV